MGGDTRLPALSALHRPAHPIVRLVAWGSRLVLHRWCASVQIRGLDRLLGVLRDEERIRRRQGVLTYANHISVMDDPTLFGSIPKDTFRRSMTTRWTMGASDIMFTNRPNAYIFRSGQVLPTDRGRGVFQPALDHSIDLLEHGGWVHIFPEGYVNMSRTARVRRFKWGVGRMLLEAGSKTASVPSPVVLPIWITGLDSMMPEPRGSPRWFPRPGAHVTITFGNPINDLLDPVLQKIRSFASSGASSEKSRPEQGEATDTALQDELTTSLQGVRTLTDLYPLPAAHLFSPPTPLKPPIGGVPWPVPLPESRSAKAIESGLDSERARLARSMVAAELRAHLVQLGERSGGTGDLAHRLMPKDDEYR